MKDFPKRARCVDWRDGVLIFDNGASIEVTEPTTGNKAHHIVSAYVTDSQIILGEIAIPEKTNEITAISEQLDLVDIKGQIVTIDAAGCHKTINSLRKTVLFLFHNAKYGRVGKKG